MRKIDSLGLKACSYQAKLFEYSIKDTKCSSKIFIRRFMNSNLAKLMDNDGFMFNSLNISDAIREIDNQYGESTYGEEKFSVEEMHWIGYIYRYWSYVAEKPSKQIYKTIKPDKMRKLYFPYHSLDPLQVIDRIMEEIVNDGDSLKNDIERGVMILRKVRNRKEKELLIAADNSNNDMITLR